MSSCDKEDADIDATEIDGIVMGKRYQFEGRSVGFYNQELTELDKAILNGSDVLIYLRGGRQKGFIRRATGLNPIKKLVADYKNELELQQHSYDYPISYSLSDLNSYGHLKFWYSYDFLVREEKE